jgi:ATP-dependent DNA ligase
MTRAGTGTTGRTHHAATTDVRPDVQPQEDVLAELKWEARLQPNEQELVIGGYTDPRGGRIGLGALLAGVYERGRLVSAGRVGTGFSHMTVRPLRKRRHPRFVGVRQDREPTEVVKES